MNVYDSWKLKRYSRKQQICLSCIHCHYLCWLHTVTMKVTYINKNEQALLRSVWHWCVWLFWHILHGLLSLLPLFSVEKNIIHLFSQKKIRKHYHYHCWMLGAWKIMRNLHNISSTCSTFFTCNTLPRKGFPFDVSHVNAIMKFEWFYLVAK